MRAFLKTPGNGLFAGGLSFAVGLDFDAKKAIEKKVGHLEANFFRPKVQLFASRLPPGRNLLRKQI